MKAKVIIPFFICLLLFFSENIFAQTYRYKQYSTYNGLPIDNVYTAAQDGNGFMWFATDFGIAKFDGYKFTNFSKSNGLTGTAVTDIVYAGGDSLIVATYPNKIQAIHYDGRINTIINNSDITLHKLVRHESEYYYYQRSLGIFGILKNGKVEKHQTQDYFKISGVILHAVISLKQRGVTFCTSKGLFVKTKDGLAHYLKNEEVFYFTEKENGNIIIACKNSIVECDTNFVFNKLPQRLPLNYRTLHMATEADGSVWFRADDKGTYKLQNNELVEQSQKLGLQNKIVNSFFIDAEKNTWFCTDGEGVLLKKRTPFLNFETQDGLANNKVLQLFKNKNKLFIGTSNGLSVKENNKISTIPIPQYTSGLNYVYKLFKKAGADVGLCMNNNFSIADFNKSDTFFKPLLFENSTIKIAKNSSLFAWEKMPGDMWLSYNSDLKHEVNGKIITNYMLASLGVQKIYTMISYANQNWLGGKGGLFTIDDNKFKKIDSLVGNKIELVYQLYADSKNRLWICTDNGLYLLDKNVYKRIYTGDTQSSNFCKDITEDGNGRLWCATWEGVYVIDDKATINYSALDGLVSKICNTIIYDSITKNILIGTDNGLSEANFEMLNTMSAFNSVYISCSISDTLNVANDISLEADQNNLNFYFNIPSFQGNDRLKYEYKLDNGSWVSMPSPSLFLSDLNSGKHTLYARVKKNGVLFTDKETVFKFTIAKAFYTTWWFWLAILLLGQIVLFKIINHYNTISKEKKLKEEKQQVEYISLKQQAFTSLMNPHFIFNALNSVQHYVNKQDRQSANKYLSDFATLIRKNFDAAQKSFVSLEEELETIRLYLALEQMRFADKFDFEIIQSAEAQDEEWMLPSMVLQPYLENAIIHGLMPLATKGMLTIKATVQNETLHISIFDNGVGIEKSKLYKTNKKHISRGMQLIKERLEMLSQFGKEPITLSIKPYLPNEENEGTLVELSFPLSTYEAFQRQEMK